MKSFLKQIVKRTFNYFGLEIIKPSRMPETYFEIDSDFNRLYNLAQEKTQMTVTDNLLRRQRHYVLNYLIQRVNVHLGNIVECGCWRGLSAYQIATSLKNARFLNKFYLFDSFEGLSEFQQYDIPGWGIKDTEKRRKQFACPLDTVKDNLKEFDFIDYKKGWIPARFHEVSDEKFVFVHIDVDLYQPIKDSLEFFYDRTLRNGIIVFDDYGYVQFPGAKKAIDEFISKYKETFFLPLPSGQAFLIKDYHL